MYSVKSISALTGLGAETLRAWERRYQAIMPDRDRTGRRSYSREDLEKLTLLAALTRQGHSIGKLAALDIAALHRLADTAPRHDDERALFTDLITDALQDYRIDRCEQLLKKALLASDTLTYARDFLSPTLKQVGQLWQAGKLTVAQEHMFSACVKRILLGLVNNLHSFSNGSPGMLFATLPDEPHEFGILMCCLLAAGLHFNCYYLGPQVPVNDLLQAARKLKTRVIVSSLIITPPTAACATALRELVSSVEDGDFRIWLGGAAAPAWLAGLETDRDNFVLLADIDDFHRRAQALRLNWKP